METELALHSAKKGAPFIRVAKRLASSDLVRKHHIKEGNYFTLDACGVLVSRAFGIATTATIAAVYAVLTVSLGSLGYSWLQVRISEALTPLPYLLGGPAILGLFVGVVVSNAFSPIGLPDLVFGPLLTLVAAILSYRLNFGRKLVACIYPVVINGFGVSAYVAGFYGVPYLLCVLTIGVGEAFSVFIVGYPLLWGVERILFPTAAQETGSAKGTTGPSRT